MHVPCRNCSRPFWTYGTATCPRCLRSAARTKERARRRALDVLGPSCSRCGLEDPWVLEVDHRRNDGAAHRAQEGTGSAVFRWIIANPVAARMRLQVLCCNCHRRKTSANILRAWREKEADHGLF